MIDPQRHLSIFNPDNFNPMPVHLIGVGATGSKIAMSLAKLGVANIHAWDGDTVEGHNVANQLYGNQDLGILKTQALHNRILSDTGIDIKVHNEMVEDKTQFNGVVFLLVDSMKARQEIFETSLKNDFRIKQVIETRMGTDFMRIYSFTPYDPSHIDGWTKTLHSDDDAEVSACGSTVSVGPTADLVSGMAVWQFIRWANGEKPDNEMIFAVSPASALTFNF